jgi:hypothetical protein
LAIFGPFSGAKGACAMGRQEPENMDLPDHPQDESK